MSTEERRKFLKVGTLAAALGLAGKAIAQEGNANLDLRNDPDAPPPIGNASAKPRIPGGSDAVAEIDGFSRFKPSRGNDPESDFYLGKKMPGFRPASAGPAPFEAPDLDKLPWKMVGGAKEFHLVPQAVRREFLPGYFMDVYGYNGSMPGPTIEVTQGDRVRIVVTNELPEDTFTHWHGFELPIQYDGAATLTQNPIKPGKTMVFEFDVHEEGTFFYHSHIPMQEAFGQVGWFIVHPKKVYDPPVDRDFGLIFQNFNIPPTHTVSDSWAMDWNWHTINGRSGPLTTPLVCKHGERVRVRLLDFSPMQHHPIHLHGHTYWETGHEGARTPSSAWVPRNTSLVGVAQATNFEFIANNPGDWIFHCHMVHHMMNHMVRHVGPRMRENSNVDRYQQNTSTRPAVDYSREGQHWDTPGYPQKMQGMERTMPQMETLWNRRESKGMRATYPMAVKGLMTVMRVLPDDLYNLVMESDEPVEKGAVFAEIVRRFGDPSRYEPAPSMMMGMDDGKKM
ncbi:Multicopper oxidase, type 3 [Rhodopirellula maiorica SM1]|uniref:Multicopper oxidase, type 3 n=1 Tax=Rhodopirellula maiorica SM1 TaxID=1265738 RepID=M5RJJ8_9BACT|nr:copper oxidase [Rhodopirellula maiorica]EMI15552.1 Multicopper oxidase, type 3 [Rhodopirellula maiorica SM1]